MGIISFLWGRASRKSPQPGKSKRKQVKPQQAKSKKIQIGSMVRHRPSGDIGKVISETSIQFKFWRSDFLISQADTFELVE